jgi:archaellum component FlaG (FlaF/FlaG flagellin family)
MGPLAHHNLAYSRILKGIKDKHDIPGNRRTRQLRIEGALMKAATKKPQTITANGKRIQPGRVGRVVIAGHFLPTVQREIKILAARESTTVAELLREALTLLLVKRGLPSVDKLEGEKTKT